MFCDNLVKMLLRGRLPKVTVPLTQQTLRVKISHLTVLGGKNHLDIFVLSAPTLLAWEFGKGFLRWLQLQCLSAGNANYASLLILEQSRNV